MRRGKVQGKIGELEEETRVELLAGEITHLDSISRYDHPVITVCTWSWDIVSITSHKSLDKIGVWED